MLNRGDAGKAALCGIAKAIYFEMGLWEWCEVGMKPKTGDRKERFNVSFVFFE